MISVVTPYKGNRSELLSVIDRFLIGFDSNFEWVIVDSSVEHLSNNDLLSLPSCISYSHQPLLGLYAAMNYGIRICSNDYYIPCGADDFIYAKALQSIESELNKTDVELNIITMNVGGSVPFHINQRSKNRRLKSHLNYISQHSVGCCINKKLHYRFGFYCEQLKIASDALFILNVVDNLGDGVIHELDVYAGKYGDSGISSVSKDKGYREMSSICLALYGRGYSFYYYLIRSFLGR